MLPRTSEIDALNLDSEETDHREQCLLMFSGGRDSTLAAVRLAQANSPIRLITVTSNHLIGIENVRIRLKELSRHLHPETEWIHVHQPLDLKTDVSFYEQTCLPCHHAYVVVSAAIARWYKAKRLAFGYAGYQSDWPEQTPLATSRLKHVLARHGINLELPTYDIATRAAALKELEKLSLSTDALEQKCSRQVTNVSLSPDRLEQQVALWESAIDKSLTSLEQIPIYEIEKDIIGNLK
ncbi:hypothetical protein [Nisaea sp.]|uniref:hypothetical protein n=1 Tax=Nisaea sp. TaxID=2024842 RepID=UPI003B51A894